MLLWDRQKLFHVWSFYAKWHRTELFCKKLIFLNKISEYTSSFCLLVWVLGTNKDCITVGKENSVVLGKIWDRWGWTVEATRNNLKLELPGIAHIWGGKRGKFKRRHRHEIKILWMEESRRTKCGWLLGGENKVCFDYVSIECHSEVSGRRCWNSQGKSESELMDRWESKHPVDVRKSMRKGHLGRRARKEIEITRNTCKCVSTHNHQEL